MNPPYEHGTHSTGPTTPSRLGPRHGTRAPSPRSSLPDIAIAIIATGTFLGACSNPAPAGDAITGAWEAATSEQYELVLTDGTVDDMGHLLGTVAVVRRTS
jgi:hypothetical protein